MADVSQSGGSVSRRLRYSPRVHDRLLRVHEVRWERMHAYRVEHGDDEEYRRLRSRMIDAALAVRRYCDQFSAWGLRGQMDRRGKARS